MIRVILFALTAFCVSGLYAQSNYLLVERGDVKVFDEIPVFVPDAKITGEFNLYANVLRGPFLQNPEDARQVLYQNFRLNFKSEVNRDISMNLSITNKPFFDGTGRGSFYPLNEKERSNYPESQESFGEVIFDIANLDYEYTPNSHFIAGLQEANLGDGKGLVYHGNNIGLSITCGLGTWCLKVGMVQTNESHGDGIQWFHIVYPVFDNGVGLKDYWNPGKERKEKYFEVNFYQVDYSDSLLPLSKNGGFTWDVTDATKDVADLSNDYQVFHKETRLPIYYEPKFKYYGINLIAFYQSLHLELNYSVLDGSRRFYTGTAGVKNETLGKKGISGRVLNLEMDFVASERYKFGAQFFVSTGTETEDTTGDYWDIGNQSYYEIHKGAFGTANIFFDGRSGSGQGHSVSNLSFRRFFYSFRSQGESFGFDLDYYSFFRTKPVLNSEGEKVQDIGRELDLGIRYVLARNLLAKLEFNMFEVGDAYVENDNDTPAAVKPKNFSYIRTSLHYKF